MKKFLLILGVIFLAMVVLVVAVGVWGGIQRGKLKPSVEVFIDEFYRDSDNRAYQKIWGLLLTQEFRDSAKRDEFEKFMTAIQQKLGALKSRSEQSWRINRAPDGLYYLVNYKTIREKGEALESFVLKRKGNGPWLLMGFNVNSKELFR